MHIPFRQLFLACVLGLLVLITGACGFISSSPSFGDSVTFEIDSPAYLVCTATCMAQAQCGTISDEAGAAASVVFIHQGNTVTSAHNGLLGNNTAVTVKEVRPEQMVRQANFEEKSQLNFYRVAFEQGGSQRDAWVAGWCIADQIVE